MAQAHTGEFTGTERFEILRIVGSGGMGLVYEAYDRERKSRVALKMLATMSPALLYRFKVEFRSLADISHPNLVSLFELLNDSDRWFISMEYVPGTDFLQYVSQNAGPGDSASPQVAEQKTVEFLPQSMGTPCVPEDVSSIVAPGLNEEYLCSTLLQLANGIGTLHAQGKLHCDIKPSNLKVTPEGRAVLLDFGLVTSLEDQLQKRRTTQLAGTVAYMSPEQLQGGALTGASDWYAVGVMVYEALTGRLPASGSLSNIVRQKIDRSFPPPSTIRPDIPPDLDQLCMDLLDGDPEKRPHADQVIARLSTREGRVHPVRQYLPARKTPLFGREAQTHELRGALAHLERREPAVVFLSGEAGSGKSSLLAGFVDELQDSSNAIVLSGRCREQESIPFKALDSLVDVLSRELRRLPPEEVLKYLPRDIDALTRVFWVLRTIPAFADSPGRRVAAADEQSLQRFAFHAMRELLARIGDHRRLVLCIDDAQWGDADSARLLTELLMPPDPPVLLLICAYREGADRREGFVSMVRQSPAVASLRQSDLRLNPLNEEEAANVARLLLGRDSVRAEAIARESAGNVYFLNELATQSADATGRDKIYSLKELLQEKVERLVPTARALLETACVSGKPLRHEVAYRAAGLGRLDPALLTKLRSDRLIACMRREDGETLEPYHDRVREVVLAEMTSGHLRERHLRLAETLKNDGRADAEALAVHFAAGGQPAIAAGYYRQAAGEAFANTAFDHAAHLFRRTMETGNFTGSEMCELQIGLADALANAGRSAEAAGIYERSALEYKGSQHRQLIRKAGYHYLISGHVAEATKQFRTILRDTGLHYPRNLADALFLLLCARTTLSIRGLRFHIRAEEQVAPRLLEQLDTTLAVAAGFGLIDVIRAAYFSSRSLLLAIKAGEPHRLAQAIALESCALAVSSASGETKALSFLETCRSLLEQHPDARSRAVYVMADGLVAFSTGRWHKAIRSLGDAEYLLTHECKGANWELSTTRYTSLLSYVNAGDYNEVSRRVPELLAIAEDSGDLYLLNWLRAYPVPIMHLAGDRPESAATVVDTVDQWRGSDIYLPHIIAYLSRILTHIYVEQYAEAWSFAEDQWPRLKYKANLYGSNTYAYCLFTRIMSAINAAPSATDPAAVLARAEDDIKRLAKLHPRFVVPMVAAARAGIAASRARDARAAEMFAEAALAFDSVDMVVLAAASRRQQGLLIGGETGQTLVTEAKEILRKMGLASPDRFAATMIGGVQPLHAAAHSV